MWEASTDEKTTKNGENSEKQRKTTKNSETAIFGAKNSRYISNFEFSKFANLPVYSIQQANSGDVHSQWMAVVNRATVIFGAKMAVIDENLNVYKLADSQNPFSALPI